MDIEIIELYEALRDIDEDITKWELDDDFYPGDRGYQQMLERRDELKEQIEALDN